MPFDSNKKKLIFIELNEINFDILLKYINNGERLNNFSKLLTLKNIKTTAEDRYEEIEPWIQWHSIHTGLKYKDHGIFRLGDGTKCNKDGVYKILEKKGYSVGAISPMNLKNNLSNPKFFIPDPWTDTSPDNNWWSKKITKVIAQIVNDNAASKISIRNFLNLIILILRFAKVRNYFIYIHLAISSLFKKTWRKALFLDLFLSDIYLKYLRKYKPDYSSLFLNGGAHIQHHYLYNSKMLNKDKNPSWYLPNDSDPFLDMLKTYDIILGNIMKINYPFILATGMSQKLNGTKEFYYRLKNHKEFFKLINLNFISCNSRMSRDCEIIFNSNHDRDEAYNILSNIREEQTKTLIFNEIEIREKSLFVILTYPKEIKKDSSIVINKKSIKLESHVVFVAIKNGKHQSKGFAFFSESLKDIIPNQNAHVSELFNLIEQFFGLGSIKK